MQQHISIINKVFGVLISIFIIQPLHAQINTNISLADFYRNQAEVLANKSNGFAFYSFLPEKKRNYNSEITDSNQIIVAKWKRKLLTEHLVNYKHENGININLDPIIDFSLGAQNSTSKGLFTNQRGLHLEGDLGKNVGIKTYFIESQAIIPDYQRFIQDSIITLSEVGRIKKYQGKYLGFNSNNIYDYSIAGSELSVHAGKIFKLELGNSRKFIGSGYRSLLLSDVSPNYPYVNITTELGRFKYHNLYAWLGDYSMIKSNRDGFYPRKYMALHYLEMAVTKKFFIGLFENVIWNDSTQVGKRGFDFNYINPIIFYRTVEFNLGSSDNVLIGANFEYREAGKYKIYSQIVLDELVISEIRQDVKHLLKPSSTNRYGWWGNKYGIQIGAKVFNVANVKGLHIALENNIVRPYTYSHRNPSFAYTSFNQALAHPLGANFNELITTVDYNFKRFYLNTRIAFQTIGLNKDSIEYGQNILKSNLKRKGTYGNEMFQGEKTKNIVAQFSCSYIVNPAYNLSVFANVFLLSSSQDFKNNTFMFGVRTSIFRNYNNYFSK